MNGSLSNHPDEDLLHSVFEASPAGMLIVDEEGIIILANRAASEQFGFSPGELLNRAIETLVPDSHRPSHASRRARYQAQPHSRAMAEGRNLFARHKDGSEFPVDISLHPIAFQQRQMVLANVLDATDRRRAEQEREQRQAMERLVMMGQLAGGVAHEIRTPLCVIRNDAYFLRTMADRLGVEGMECVDEINEAVSKAERIVSELLDFTRDPRSQLDEVAVSSIVEAAIRSAGLPPSVMVEHPQPSDRLFVRADGDQIERILVNLLRNAAQAAGDQARIEVTAWTQENVVVIEVTDNGPGIDLPDLERVFEPLYTTKPNGIGLGLSVSRQYAERNGGTLTAHQRAGSGACFRMSLPWSHDRTATQLPPESRE
jgi:two-component system sensor kinase FixL